MKALDDSWNCQTLGVSPAELGAYELLVKDSQEARDTILESIEDVPNFKLAETQITSRKVWIDIVAEGKGITESNNSQAISEFNMFMNEVF